MKTKNVLQLDEQGYFLHITVADESPLEPGVFLFPRGTIDAQAPVISEGFRYKWNGSSFDAEAIPQAPTEPSKTEDELFNENIMRQIFQLESQLTQRRFREAALSGDNSFILDIDNQITALRVQLR